MRSSEWAVSSASTARVGIGTAAACARVASGSGLPGERREADEAAHRLGEAREAPGDEPGEVEPGRLRLGEEARQDQRVARGGRDHRGDRALLTRAERAHGERVCVIVRESIDRDRRELERHALLQAPLERAGERRARPHRAGAMGQDHEHARRVGRLDERHQRIDRVAVTPVYVLDDDHDRLRAREQAHESSEKCTRAGQVFIGVRRLRSACAQRARRVFSEELPEDREHARERRQVRRAREQRRDLEVGACPRRELVERRVERLERDALGGKAATVHDEGTALDRLRREARHDRGLAEARVAKDARESRHPGEHAIEQHLQACQLGCASEERRQRDQARCVRPRSPTGGIGSGEVSEERAELRSLRGVAREHAVYALRPPAGQVGARQRKRARWLHEARAKASGRIPRGRVREARIHEQPRGEDIGRGRQHVEHELLGRHPCGRTRHLTRARGGVAQTREPEVEQHHFAIARDEHVVGLEIEVHETTLVQRRERLEETADEGAGTRLIYQRAAVGRTGGLGEHRRERPPVDERHDQRQRAIVRDEIGRRDERWMGEVA